MRSLSACGMLIAALLPVLGVAQKSVPSRAIVDTSGAPVDTLAPRRPVLPPPPPTPPRTDYRVLRFDETWSHTGGGGWSDAIKAMPIAPQLSLTVGGQVRAREEFMHAFTFSGVSDAYALSRTLIDVDLKAGPSQGWHSRLFAEFRDAQGFSRDLPGGVRPMDADRSDVQNLFADVGHGRSFVRYGRQEVVSGRERLIGVPDWANTRRGLQGVRAFVVHGALSVDLLDVRPMIVRQRASNRADSATRFRTITLGSAPGFTPHTRLLPTVWQAYHYDQQVSGAANTHRTTSGGRLQWTFGSSTRQGRSYALETESAVQRGTVGTRDIRAWFFTSEASTQWRGVRGAPTMAFGLEMASGDATGSDNTLGAFNVLYNAAHQHGGYADFIGRPNLRSLQLISTWDPFRRVSLRGALYRMDRISRRDGIYTKQNTLLRAAGTSTALHAGDELDITANAAITRHLKVIAGHAFIEPGAFLRRSVGGARSARWGFVGTTYTF